VGVGGGALLYELLATRDSFSHTCESTRALQSQRYDAFAVLSDACLPLARGSASQFPQLPQAENNLVLQICTRPSNFIVLGRFAHRAVLLLARAAPGSWVPLPLSFLGTIDPALGRIDHRGCCAPGPRAPAAVKDGVHADVRPGERRGLSATAGDRR